MQDLTQLSRLVAPRPGSSSGVYAIRRDACNFKSLTEAIEKEAIFAVSNEDWSKLKTDLGTDSSSQLTTISEMLADCAIVPFFSEDLIDAARYNLRAGFVDFQYLQSTILSCDKYKFYNNYREFDDRFPFFAKSNQDFGIIYKEAKSRGIKALIAKPIVGSGSEGVSCVDLREPDALERAAEFVRRTAHESSEILFMEPIVSDEEPSEIALNFIVVNGTVCFISTHSKAVQTREPPFRDLVIVSYKPPVSEISAINSISHNIAQSLELMHGVVQAELRRDLLGRWFPIDVALRPDGGLIPDSIIAMHQIDFRMAHALFQIGRPDKVLSIIESGTINRSIDTALGAFYSKVLTTCVFEKIFNTFHERKSLNENLVSGMYSVEGSLMPLASPELRVGLCVKGNTEVEAVSELMRIAEIFTA